MIIKYPNPILLKTASPLTFPLNTDDKARLKQLWDDYLEPASWGRKVGLAAPQIGESIRAFVAQGQMFINPVLISTKGEAHSTEGCYSLNDNISYRKKRASSLKIKWQAESGFEHTKRFTGFDAFVIQHELDHLEGKFCNQ
jgi:peptide deformylase